MKRILPGTVVAAALVVACTANAADIARPVYKAPLVAPVYSWTGFYIGGNAGYTSLDTDGRLLTTAGNLPGIVLGVPQTLAGLASGAGKTRSDSFIGGGQIGFNWQWSNWVVGVEADLQGISSNSNSASFTTLGFPVGVQTNTVLTMTNSLDYLGTVRGRLGFLANPQLLIYGTGGLAYGNVSSSWVVNQSAPGNGGFQAQVLLSTSDTRFGWTAGGGFEYKLTRNWSFKGEYLYYDLGDIGGNANFISTTPAVFSGNVLIGPSASSASFTGYLVRAGVNYQFDWGKTPVVAKY